MSTSPRQALRARGAGGFRRRWRVALVALLMAGRAWGSDGTTNAPALFDAAGRLYEQAQYRAAAEAYEAMAGGGAVSSALYFNLGNAWYKTGEAGRAIRSYRLAERLAPRDPDIRANLRMTRELVLGGEPPAPPVWRRLQRWLTPDEWASLTAALAWTCFGALALRQWRPATGPGWTRLAAVTGAGGLVAAVLLLAAWQEIKAVRDAVVVVDEAVVRYGPLEVSPELVKLTDGAEVRVLDRKDGWLQVSGFPRGPGWIAEGDVLLVAP